MECGKVFLIAEKYIKIGGGKNEYKKVLYFFGTGGFVEYGREFLPVNAAANPVIKAATPTPRSALKTALFDLKNANTVPPVDIINQISFTGRGGGGLCKPISYTSPILLIIRAQI
ncbi:MAG: hypothetical protein IPN96_07160 [Anaerolineales bacterium]|nr:hypothetical protein [Anaerolineales bacterium]